MNAAGQRQRGLLGKGPGRASRVDQRKRSSLLWKEAVDLCGGGLSLGGFPQNPSLMWHMPEGVKTEQTEGCNVLLLAGGLLRCLLSG